MFDNYLHRLQQLPLREKYTKEELLTPEFLLSSTGDLEMYFAPHNLYINKRAIVVIVGLCPGWTQTELADRTYRKYYQAADVLKKCKRAGRFAGSMRDNLIAMLDELGLASFLHFSSTEQLFTLDDSQLHTTSLLPFPVFYKGKNYNGYSPVLHRSSFLMHAIERHMSYELQQFTHPILCIPLGASVERVLTTFSIPQMMILNGFPHPSGANGHRQKLFSANEQEMKGVIEHFFKMMKGEI